MFGTKKNGMMKKLAVTGTALALMMSLSVSAFADGQPGGNGNMGGMSGRQSGFEESNPSGGSENFGGNMNLQMPENQNPQQPNGGQPSGMNPQDMDSDREDMIPPEDSDTEPGENVPEKPENDTQTGENAPEKPENDAQPENEKGSREMAPGNKPDGSFGIDMKAVEAYIQEAGDDADENVRSAYDALSAALAADPDESEENDQLAELESALTEALETADVDLSQYAETPELPENPSENPGDEFSGRPENAEKGQPGAEKSEDVENAMSLISMIQKSLDRVADFFRNL